jgi:TonB-dependent starch-binding outer membrane protein SusC
MNVKKLAKGMLCLCLALFSTMAYAQNNTVTGKITNATDGTPIAGISVIGETTSGKKVGTSTASDGTYKLSSSDGFKKIVLTGAGFLRREEDVVGKSEVSYAMTTANTNLNEVVVVGYGTRKIKDLTGSVAAIGTKDFNKGVISTPEQLIAGRTPGVTVVPGDGQPGSASTINIRGSSSIRGNNVPLYVVDGVPLFSGGTSGNGGSGVEGDQTPINPLAFLNPNDIESMTILKDASSAAIYGSRGANGVILITTKSGRSTRGALTFNSSVGISKPASRYDLLDATDFLKAVKAANIAAGTSEQDAAVAVTNVDKGASTDWQDEIFQTGVAQNYNLGWGISKKGTTVRLSGSYDNQKGIVKTSSLERLTAKANITQKLINDKLTLNAALTYGNVKNTYAPNSTNAGYQGSLIGAAIAFNPTYPVYDAQGYYYDPKDGNRNPTEMLNYFTDGDNINRYLMNLSAGYEIIKGLTYKATYGYDNSSSLRKSFSDPRLGSNAFGGTTNVNGVDYKNNIFNNGRAIYQDFDVTSNLFENTLTYDKSFAKGQDLNAVVGYSYQGTTYEGSGTVGWGLTTPVVTPQDVFIKDMNNFVNQKAAYIPFYSKEELQSYFGRVNYTINNKYLLTATLRIDGSSKFGTNNKYGTFPAFAAKWKIMNEDFAAKSLGNVFNEFSLRANWGILGSQDGLGAYDALNIRTIYPGNSGNLDTSLNHQGNNDLKWETATTTGAGIDFALKGNRLSGTIDYYYTTRKNLLFYGPVPGGFSASSNYFSNLPGSVVNQGVEVSLNYQAIKKTKFSWDISYNMTFYSNEMKGFDVAVNTGVVNGQGLSGAYAQTFANGYPLFTWKMPVFEGFDGNGYARYANGSKDQLLGSALPTFTAGLTNSFSFGRWNASIFVNAATGFYVYNNTANALFLAGSIKTAHNVTYEVANSGESPINPGSVSSRFLEKGDFLRFANSQISYNFNIKNKYIKTLTATLGGQNLILITNYSGLDPEVNVSKPINGVPSRGFDYAGYPKAKTVTIGLNLGF